MTNLQKRNWHLVEMELAKEQALSAARTGVITEAQKQAIAAEKHYLWAIYYTTFLPSTRGKQR
jgi:hypothetical protein